MSHLPTPTHLRPGHGHREGLQPAVALSHLIDTRPGFGPVVLTPDFGFERYARPIPGLTSLTRRLHGFNVPRAAFRVHQCRSTGRIASEARKQFTKPTTNRRPRRALAGTWESVSTPKPNETATVLISAGGPVSARLRLRAAIVGAPLLCAWLKLSSKCIAQFTPMPSVIAANIEVATPSGIPSQPITANLITTASALGSTQKKPQRHEPPNSAVTRKIPSSDQPSDCNCVVTMPRMSDWLNATSPAKPSLIPSGARCSRS